MAFPPFTRIARFNQVSRREAGLHDRPLRSASRQPFSLVHSYPTALVRMQVQINRLLELSLAKRSCALERAGARTSFATLASLQVASWLLAWPLSSGAVAPTGHVALATMQLEIDQVLLQCKHGAAMLEDQGHVRLPPHAIFKLR